MPRKKRTSRRFPLIPERDFVAIHAALRMEPCPPGANRFLHLSASFPSRRGRHWLAVVGVFRSLEAGERRSIVQRRRASRFASMLVPDDTYEHDPRRVLRGGNHAA